MFFYDECHRVEENKNMGLSSFLLQLQLLKHLPSVNKQERRKIISIKFLILIEIVNKLHSSHYSSCKYIFIFILMP